MPNSRPVRVLVLCVAGFTVAPAIPAGVILQSAVDVIGSLPSSVFSAYGYGANTYKDWGNEPSIAVNPANPNQIVVSSFAYGTSSTTSGANLFYSTNGGQTWGSYFSVPAPAAGVVTPNDWRFAYDPSGMLHAAVLGGCSACNVYVGSTTDPTSRAAWTWSGGGAPVNTTASKNYADQPWIATAPNNRLYVAYDDFHYGTDVRVAASTDNGGNFAVDRSLLNAPVGSSVNPGTRIATDAAGTVYAIYGVGSTLQSNGVHYVGYFLNRSRDGGNTWDFAASSDVGGIEIGEGVSDQLNNSGTQSNNNWFAHVNDIRGNYTAVASDAAGNHVYTVWSARDSDGIDRLYLTEFHPSAGGLARGATTAISVAGKWSALPSVTVLATGAVVVMYDAYDAKRGMLEVHVAVSRDFGASVESDAIAYDFAPMTLLAATGSATRNREFGDYQFIASLGNTFYGSFAARGNNLGANDTSNLIDPFVITGADSVPEPGGAALAAAGAAVLALARARIRDR